MNFNPFVFVKATFQRKLPESAKWFPIDSRENYLKNINDRLSTYYANPKAAAFKKSYYFTVLKTMRTICKRLVQESPDEFNLEFGNLYIVNKITGKKFPLYWGNPIVTLLNLVSQDINLLYSKDIKEEHKLEFSITIYSVGWYVKDRLGWTLTDLHKHVPTWKEHIKPRAVKLFNDMKSGKQPLMYRTNLFVQFGSKLAMYSTEDYFTPCELKVFSNLYLRREYQVFYRVGPKKVIFIVDTQIEPLSNFTSSELNQVYLEFDKMAPGLKNYHNFYIWGPILKRHIKDIES